MSVNTAVVSNETTLLPEVVGLADVDHTTPRSLIGEFPSEAIVAPSIAVVEVTPENAGAISVGTDVLGTMEAVITRFVSIATVRGFSVS